MIDVKTFVASIAVLLYVFLPHGIRAEPNIRSSSEDDFCSQMEEKWKVQVVENMRMQCALYSQLQTVENHRLNFELEKKQLRIETLENESISQADENHRLNFELEKKQKKIETLENEPTSQADENHPLNFELEKKQLKIETLENEIISQAEKHHLLNFELEKKQLKIETLENESISQVDENHRLRFELEKKQLKIETLENESISQADDNHRLNFDLEKKQLKIETLENESISQANENHRLNVDLEKKQLKIETFENQSISQPVDNHRLNLELEKKQLKIETLENQSISQADDNHRLNVELEKKQLRIETLENESISQADENHRLSRDLEKKQLKTETLTNLSISQSEEIQQLKLENEKLRLTTQPVSVTATLLRSIDSTSSIRYGITAVEDSIYVLHYRPPNSIIEVFENGNDFRFVKKIPINTNWLLGIVYSSISKCVYIIDHSCCIWAMTTTGEHRLTKWLTNIPGPFFVLSLSNEGHLLVLRGDRSPSQLEIYSVNATLVRTLQLPQDIKIPHEVVQTSAGNFIIVHTLNNQLNGPWVISQLTNDGHFINRYIPRNQERVHGPQYYLSLDSDNNRLFLAESSKNRVIVFDSSVLTWNESQVLMFDGKSEIYYPMRISFDASKKHLFVLEKHSDATVFKINYHSC